MVISIDDNHEIDVVVEAVELPHEAIAMGRNTTTENDDVLGVPAHQRAEVGDEHSLMATCSRYLGHSSSCENTDRCSSPSSASEDSAASPVCSDSDRTLSDEGCGPQCRAALQNRRL